MAIRYPDSDCETHKNVVASDPVCILCLESEISALRERVKELEEEFADLISCFSRDDSTSTDWVCTLNDSERTAIKALLSTGREEG